jgi:hypothetical protein
MTEARFELPAAARMLGDAGLVPFAALAAALWWTEGAAKAQGQAALLAYGAVIVSFLGAVHWGAALAAARRDALPYAWSVLPALLAWVAALLPFAWGAPLLSLLLIVCWAADRLLLLREPFGASYLRLRTRLSLGACTALVLGRLAGPA